MTNENLGLVSKISVAKCHGKLDKKNLPKGAILRVAGIATGTKTGTSNYGPWTALTGDFYAVNLESGEEFRAGKAFLPSTALGLVEGALSDSPEGVEFAFDFGVKAAENAIGYEYTVKPVVKAKESDRMAQLLAQVQKESPVKIGHDGGKGKGK